MSTRNERILEASNVFLDGAESVEESAYKLQRAVEDAFVSVRKGEPGSLIFSVTYRPFEDDSISIDEPLSMPSDSMVESSAVKRHTFSDRLNNVATFVGGSVIEALQTSKEAVELGVDKGKSVLENKKVVTGAAAAAVLAPVVVSSPAVANEVVNEIVVEFDETSGIANEDAKEQANDNSADDSQTAIIFEGDEDESAALVNPTSSSMDFEEDNTVRQVSVVEEVENATSVGDTSVRGSEVSIVTSDSQSVNSDDNGETIKVIFESTDEGQSEEVVETDSQPTVQDSDEQTQNSVETTTESGADTATEESDDTPVLEVPVVETVEIADANTLPDEPEQELAEGEPAEEAVPVVEESTADEPELTPEVPTEETVVIVKKGDTLSELVEESGEEINDVAKRSGIADPNKIYPGDEVLLSKSTNHIIVKSGQTLSGIARANNSTAEELGRLNDIFDINIILAGQKIRLPGFDEMIIVEEGQTLGALSIEFEIPVEEIVRVNDIDDENLILAGQELLIPVEETEELIEDEPVQIEQESSSNESTEGAPAAAEQGDTIEEETEKAEVNLPTNFQELLEQGPILDSVEAFAEYKWDTTRDGSPDHPLLKEAWEDWSRAEHAQALLELGNAGWIEYDAGVEQVLKDIIETGGFTYVYGNDGDDFDRDELIEMNRNILRILTVSAMAIPEGHFTINNLTDGGHISDSNHFTDKRDGESRYGLGNAADIGNASQAGYLYLIAEGLVLNQDMTGDYRELILTDPRFDNQINHGKPYVYSEGTAKGHGGNNLHIHFSQKLVLANDPTPSVVVEEVPEAVTEEPSPVVQPETVIVEAPVEEPVVEQLPTPETVEPAVTEEEIVEEVTPAEVPEEKKEETAVVESSSDSEVAETSSFEQRASDQKERFINNLNNNVNGVAVDKVKELFKLLHDEATSRGIHITDEGYVAVITHAVGESSIRPTARGGAGEGGVWQWKGSRANGPDGEPVDLSTLEGNVEHFFYDASRDSNFLEDIQNPDLELHDMVTEGYRYERPSSWFDPKALAPEPPLKERSEYDQAGTFRWGIAEKMWEDLTN